MSDEPTRPHDHVLAAVDKLRTARGPENPNERAELRDEVRILAALLIAEELSSIADSMAIAAKGIDSAIASLSRLEK